MQTGSAARRRTVSLLENPGITASFLVARPARSCLYMWTVEEYLETWLKCSPRGCSRARLELQNGGRIRVHLMKETGIAGLIEGEFLEIEPDRSVRMHWTVQLGSSSSGMQVGVLCAGEGQGTRMTVTIFNDAPSSLVHETANVLSASLLRLEGLLRT